MRAAFESNISFTAEFPAWRGAKGVPPTRAYWEEKAEYITMQQMPAMVALIADSGAQLNTIAECLLGKEFQKYTTILPWPDAAARPPDGDEWLGGDGRRSPLRADDHGARQLGPPPPRASEVT